MAIITYGLCPNCNKVTSKSTITGDSSQPDQIRYVKGTKCDTPCYGRTAKQKPDNAREKR